MLPIKYVGPRPIISQHGITYKEGKEDKYIYLTTALEILRDINFNYEDKKSYSHPIHTKPITTKQMEILLKDYESQLEQHILDEKNRYEQKIQQEIQDVQHHQYLSDIDKEVWINNIKLMKDYRIQRAINKIYYMHCINDIKKVILREHLKEIDTPFNEKFWHVLQTLQGILESGKNSKNTKLTEETSDDNNMILKLYINH